MLECCKYIEKELENVKVRKGIQISTGLALWYEEKAKELGVSQSSLIVMAMNLFKNQQETLDMSKQIPEWLAMAQEIQAQEKENKND